LKSWGDPLLFCMIIRALTSRGPFPRDSPGRQGLSLRHWLLVRKASHLHLSGYLCFFTEPKCLDGFNFPSGTGKRGPLASPLLHIPSPPSPRPFSPTSPPFSLLPHEASFPRDRPTDPFPPPRGLAPDAGPTLQFFSFFNSSVLLLGLRAGA